MKAKAISAVGIALLAGCGGGGGGSSSSGAAAPNNAPSIGDTGTLSVLEGETTVAALSASDADGDELRFSILAGDDRARFAITTAGALSFVSAPDFEAPSDANTDNEYEVEVQVSDGTLTDSQTISVRVDDAFEGRVVDGPISGAAVIVDLNGNGVLDDDETSGTTDSEGFFKVPTFTGTGTVTSKIIAKGGTDTFTSKTLPQLTLISDIPADVSKAANVTPLTTVLSALETQEEKTQALESMGITTAPEVLLTSDNWAAAEAGNSDAQAAQRVNVQIALLLQTAGTLTQSANAESGASLLISQSVAAQVATAALASDSLDFASAELMKTVLAASVAAVPPELEVSEDLLTSVAASIANLNTLAADQTANPLSTSGLAIALAAQEGMQNSLANVFAGELSLEEFEVQSDPVKLLLSVDAPDLDGDGSPDVVDQDDDGDGVADVNDAFPKDRNEYLDSDGDGAGNNADPDDDGDGFADAVDAFPLEPSEWLDTDGDGTGNNADSDDDGDGVSDVNDAFPLNGANAVDTDGDGVLDILDVQPNDSSVAKALQVDLTGVESLGLGEAIENTAEVAAARVKNAEDGLAYRLLDGFLKIFTPEALAEETLAVQTNAVTWDDEGDILAASILSSDTFFIAEANVSPDGKYVYLLTSDHIQTRMTGLDPEVCTVYRVQLADMTFQCLLKTEDGDVEPKSLAPSQSTDFAHRGIAFRSDGAAIMRGFDYTLEDVDGAASVSVWFMSPEGELTALEHERPYEASAAYWLTDDTIAVAEHSYQDALGEDRPQNRFALYSAETLQRVAVISEGVGNLSANSPRVRKGTDIYWDSLVLRGDSLSIENSGGEGSPLLDADGDRLLFLVDSGANKRIFDPDGDIDLAVTDGEADLYSGVKQTLTGTDIKYPPVGFSSTHLAYRKTYEPAEPIQTLDGGEFLASTTYELSNGQGSVEIPDTVDIFMVRPAADYSGDLTIDYEVLTAEGALESRSLTIASQAIESWRDGDGPNSGQDSLNWVSPNAQREGFCVYEFETNANKCANFSQYQSLAANMQYFSGNDAISGIQNTLLTGDQIRVFFKDSVDQAYYQALGNVADFMESGLEALTITAAVNGAGDNNVISDAIRMRPAPYLEITDASIAAGEEDEITIDFGRPLSVYAALPILSLVQGETVLQLMKEVDWSEDRSQAVLSFSRVGLNAEDDVELQVDGPIFLPNQIRRYRLAQPLSVTVADADAPET